MIRANCRERFTAADFDFVVKSLARSEKDSTTLVDLLTDAEARDAILDHPLLFERILEHGAPLHISPQFYFYVLIRHVLKETGLADCATSDYVASLLEKFSTQVQMRSPADGRTGPVQYMGDMMVALQKASPRESFLIQAHMGNYALFITGIFHERVQSRSQRGAPDVGFYEDVGRTSFAAVARHEVARSGGLTEVFESLAAEFRDVRLALNRLADSLLHLDRSPEPYIFVP